MLSVGRTFRTKAGRNSPLAALLCLVRNSDAGSAEAPRRVCAIESKCRGMLAIKIGLVGAGRMATALARGFVAAELVPPSALLASYPQAATREAFEREVPGAKVVAANGAEFEACDVVILAVKPQMMTQALSEVRGHVRADALVISIAAGVTIERLVNGLGTSRRIVRVMPNTPCLIGKGASAFSLGPTATADDGELVARLLAAVGIAFAVPEKQLDAVTGLSGSGPAYVYTLIEQLTEGGRQVGLSAELAASLAAQTVAGAAEMVLSTGETPAVLRDRVTSPGGTTLAGLKALEDNGFGRAIVAAVEAATQRSIELGKLS
jgi:pyrroline-5-carboxylate reductase